MELAAADPLPPGAFRGEGAAATLRSGGRGGGGNGTASVPPELKSSRSAAVDEAAVEHLDEHAASAPEELAPQEARARAPQVSCIGGKLRGVRGVGVRARCPAPRCSSVDAMAAGGGGEASAAATAPTRRRGVSATPPGGLPLVSESCC
mmetsp:Transcript_47616/g.153087  ORF Transcript_47616/g.153087 Transcript_47616/m.153087 type:complete len:149 (-) Transcript_47616:178-624(-)